MKPNGKKMPGGQTTSKQQVDAATGPALLRQLFAQQPERCIALLQHWLTRPKTKPPQR
ncbi:hypothetical protein ACFOSS_13575 [Pseudaeromonas sharmana]|uniref:Uncharacterized protein n=1 Tax=Pseudaeromonas sharmana TaxID=328412 RepID=A0ABV8CQK7_9GAMM